MTKMYIFNHGHVTYRDYKLIGSRPWPTFSHGFTTDSPFGHGFAFIRDKNVIFWSQFCS